MGNNILIKNGNVMDGTGNPASRTDVLIKGDQIEDIGLFEDVDAEKIIDAKDLIIAPGFIDVHTHLDFLLPSVRHAEVLEKWVRMGVTTIVGGNCGFSPAPINHDNEKNIKIYWNFALPRDSLEFQWDTMQDYLNFLEKGGQALNVAMLTGHNTLRNNVMGFNARFATPKEISEMTDQLVESLDAGTFGLSLGLGYVPGIYSHTDELMELASVLTDYKLPLIPHTRGLSNLYDKAVEEVINIAEQNKIPLQISHNGSFDVSAGSRANEIIKNAMKRGVKIGYDMLPYLGGSSTAFCGLSPLLLDGGVEKCFERLQDPEIREKTIQDIKKNAKIKWPNWDNQYWTDVYLRSSKWEKILSIKMFMHGFRLKKNRKFENMPLKKIAKILKKNYLEVFLDFVQEEQEGLFFSGFSTSEKISDKLMKDIINDPNCSIETDVVGADFNIAHPIQYGAFTKVLGNLARDKKYMPMEEAVRKMSSLPAQQMQIDERGIIKKGFFADIIVFDPKTVKCVATFDDPYKNSVGIENVIINGKLVLENGKYKARALAGKVLRKT